VIRTPARRGWEAPAPSWGGNNRIVFTENRTGHPNYEVYSVRASGSRLRRLTHDRLTELTPSVSPSGTRITMVTTNNVTLATKIAVMRSDGSHLHAITPDWGKRRLQEAGW
jgi:Tol biopolymer transport system component